MAKRVDQKVLESSMTEFWLRGESDRTITESENDFKIHRQISAIYEKIAGKDFCKRFSDPEVNVADSRSMEHGWIRC
jgi:hypothetical protein